MPKPPLLPTRSAAILGLGLLGVGSPGPALAMGLFLQAVVSGSADLIGPSPPGGAAPFALVPALRIGALTPGSALTLNLSYTGSGDAGDPRARHRVTAGPDVLPFLWQSPGGRARLYLLLGANAGAQVQLGTAGAAEVQPTGGFSVGLGGHYLPSPRLGLGLEVGSRTQLSGPAGAVTATSSLYGALTGMVSVF